jgi:hypothetical protein
LSLTRSKPLARTGFKRKPIGGVFIGRKQGIRKRSKKGERRARERAKLTAELIEPGVTLCVVQSPVCWRWAHHLHHIVKSGQGGPDTKENCVPSCDPCNGYIEQNREWARANGWEKERGAA